MKPPIKITQSLIFIVSALFLSFYGCSKKPTPIVNNNTGPSQTVTVSTIAGGTKGYKDGDGLSAQFDSPNSIAIDATGNLYIVDYNNGAIRKIAPGGSVTTLYHSATDAYGLYQITTDNGGNLFVSQHSGILYKITPAGALSFYGPFQPSVPVAIACDASGNIYEACYAFKDYYIKKITTDGKSAIYAGNGSPGHADGPLLSATLTPTGLAIDQSGNLFELEAGNDGDLIRKITATDVVTMKLSNVHVVFQSPSNLYPGEDMAVDLQGNLYIADFYGNMIKKVTAAGVVSVLAGSGVSGHADGAGSTAQFSNPTGITIDAAGNLYVSEAGDNNDVRKITIK